MKLLILEPSASLAAKLEEILLTLGLRSETRTTRAQAHELLQHEPDLKIAIVDIDNHAVEGAKLMEDLSRQQGAEFRFILHSALSMDEVPAELMQKNIIGHLLKPFDAGRVESALKIIFSSINFPELDKRRHIRITPDKGELLRVQCKLGSKTHPFYGKILNLSLGGLALELLGPLDEALLKEGMQIPYLAFSVDCHTISTAGTLQIKRGRFLAIRFLAMDRAKRIQLARYILKKLQ